MFLLSTACCLRVPSLWPSVRSGRSLYANQLESACLAFEIWKLRGGPGTQNIWLKNCVLQALPWNGPARCHVWCPCSIDLAPLKLINNNMRKSQGAILLMYFLRIVSRSFCFLLELRSARWPCMMGIRFTLRNWNWWQLCNLTSYCTCNRACI